MPRITVATVLKLLAASFVAGAVMAYFEISPKSLLERLGQAAREVVDTIGASAGTFVSYVLLGAVVVVPVWLVGYLWRAAKAGRSGKSKG